jgi:hypothetical protein
MKVSWGNRSVLVGVLLAVWLPVGGLQGQQDKDPPPPKGMVRILGRDNPELIPQWLAWRSMFQNLALTGRKPGSGFWEPYEFFTPSELSLLREECFAQAQRDQQLWTMLDKELKRLRSVGADAAAMKKSLDAMEIEWRWTVLNARDRVLAGLSLEHQLILWNELELHRKGVAAYMPETDLDQFPLPQ